MKLLSKFLFVFALVILGFTAKTASAATCQLNASGLWSAAATWINCGGVAPTAADDVVGTTTSLTLTINGRTSASSTARSVDFSMFPGTIIATSTGVLAIGTSSATTSNVALKLGSSMTITASTTAAIAFVSTVATSTIQTITCAGKTLPALVFTSASGGGYAFIDNCNAAIVTTPQAYEIHFDGLTDSSSLSHTFTSFVGASNSLPKGVHWGNATVTLTGTGASIFTVNNTSTFIATSTATIRFTGAAPSLSLGTSVDYKGLSLDITSSCTGAVSITVNNSIFKNITRTGAANRTSTLSTGRLTITGTFTVNGSSILDRTSVTPGSSGTAVIISAAAISFSNVDLMDINGQGAASWNLSGITGGSGDMLGNIGITFTTATTTYWIGDTGNTASTTMWSYASGGASGARVPLPQDNCIFDSNSFTGTGKTVTFSMPRSCKDLDFSLVGTDNPTLTVVANLTYSVYGSFILDSGMTFSNITGVTLNFAGRTAHNVDFQGVSMPRPITFYAPLGTYTFLNDLLSVSTVSLYLGTTTLGSFGITTTAFSTANSSSIIVNAGSGAWYITGTGAAWTLGTNSVWNGQTATINFVNLTATSKTIAHGATARTYFKMVFTGGNFITTGSPTIATLGLEVAGYNGGFRPTTLTTTTITTLFYTNATTTAARALASSTSMTVMAELKFTGGTVCGVDYVDFVRILATPPGAWQVGTNSTSTGSSGLTFTYNACATGTVTPPPLIDFSFLERDKYNYN